MYDRVTEPYSYSQGFHHLLSFARQRMDKDDMLRICKALVSFRPPFIATVTNLSRQDLVFMEKCFQRTVLVSLNVLEKETKQKQNSFFAFVCLQEFNKLLTSIGTPTCVWRRTGELALVSKEFSLLTQWSVEDLLGKSTYIYEVLANAIGGWVKLFVAVNGQSGHSRLLGKVCIGGARQCPTIGTTCFCFLFFKKNKNLGDHEMYSDPPRQDDHPMHCLLHHQARHL